MRKLFTLLALLFIVISARATHLMGGQITTQQVSGFTYEVKLTLYRDMTGIPILPSQDIYIQFPGGSFTVLTIYHTGAVNFLNGVEEYTYVGYFQTGLTGSHNIFWVDCCRNEAIQNLPNPGGNSFALVNILEVDTIAGNSSPVFLNPPVVIAGLLDPFTYNPLPYDADGDSLAWSLVIPLDAAGTPVLSPPLPIPGYVLPYADTSGPFTMNPQTGEITWVPNTLGNFVASFLVEEFRNGVKIGEIRRDMQYIVVEIPGMNNLAQLQTATWPTDPSGNFSFDVQVNTPFTLTVVATDTDGDVLNLVANGEPFILQNNPAQFTLNNGIPGYVSAEFSWNTTSAQQRTMPYIVAFRIFETVSGYTLVSDKTVQFNVGNFTSVIENTPDLSIGNIYPVPSAGSIYLPVTITRSSEVQITAINSLGQKVNSVTQKLNPGSNLLYLHNLLSTPGLYFVNITLDGVLVQTEKVIIK